MDENNLDDGMPPTIGRYKVLEGIGFGAMGAVYKAFDPLIKRTLAIKTIRLDIPRQSPQYKSFIERFYHEARISGTLSHPNIVTLFDIGEEAGVPYLAMEFVEGETIASIVERGVRFKPEKVVGLVSQIAAALDYAHSKGVIHRDVKPANLMLYEGDRVKVTDFGIAKLVDAEMTQSGTLLGTPSYMSPEQAMGDKLDGRSDIFSLGVCAFEMLSGEQPFPGTNVTSILYKLVHVDPVEPPNLEMNGLVPQKWHEVFGKVLAKKPDDRYQDAGAFVRDLEYCLGSWFGALGNEQTIVAAPPPSEDESPATVLMKAPRVAPPPAPAPLDDSGTVMLKAPLEDTGTVLLKAPLLDDSPATVMLKAPPAPPASDEDDSPATVMLKAPPAPMADEDSPATVMLKAPPVPQARRPAAAPPPEESDPATVMLKVPSARPAAPPPVPAEEEDSATVVLSGLPDPDEEPVTILLKTPPDTSRAPGPARAQPPPKVRPPAPRAKATDTAPVPPADPGSITDKVPVTMIVAAPVGVGAPPAGPSSASTPRKPGVSPLLLLGGAAVLFLGAAAVVVWLMFGRTPAAETTTDPTTLAATVTPPPPDAPSPVPVEPVGVIHVETQPPGAAVNVNGETRGATPLDLTGLAFGAYDIKLELKGYDPRTQKVEVTEQAPRADVNVALTRPTPVQGTADILSTPFGAAITVDGASVGVTPLTDLKLKPGSRKVDITKEGFEPWTGVVTVQAGKRARLDAQLKTVVKATPTPGPPPEVLDANKVYLPSEVDTPPKKVSGMSPSYPEKAAPKLKSGQSVSVVVTWVVSESGEVTDITVVQSASKVVDDAVTGAIANYKYQPALKKGVKVKVKLTLKQTFQSG